MVKESAVVSQAPPASGRSSIALLGFGRFGRIHARCLRAHPWFSLDYVVDPCPLARADAKAEGFRALSSSADLPAFVVAASVVTPLETHARLACTLMQQGLHVLVEKPLADREDDVARLLQVAHQADRVLCAGHVERFKTWSVEEVGGKGIEFHRVSRARLPGHHAVMDLLVHDLDLIAYWLNVPPEDELRIDIVGLEADRIEVHAELAGVPLHLHAGYGAEVSRATVRCGQASGLASRLFELAQQPMVHLYGDDPLTRQYSAFHKRLSGQTAPIADVTAGSAAARRALSILRAL